MDNNLSSLLPEDNPAKITARRFEKEYGDSIAIMVGLERPYGTVFDAVFLRRIREFSEALEFMPLVKDVNSIMSTQYISSDSESIIVTDLVGGDFSGTPEEIAELKRRIDSWDMYRGALVSEDLSSTQIVVRLNASLEHAGDPEVLALVLETRDRAEQMFSGLAEAYTAGQPVVSAALTEAAFTDIRFLIPLAATALLAVRRSGVLPIRRCRS
jgi:predicted RND superfamily exporter protein